MLSSVGASTYALLRDLLAPAAPKSKSFDDIKTALCQHHEPEQAIIAKRFQFHKRDQGSGECIAEYDAQLRKLASHCSFGEHLEESLCDRFVCGLRHEAIQRRLLSEVDLTYAKAMELALGMEAADRDTKAFKALGSDPTVKKLQRTPTAAKSRGSPCPRCNQTGHQASMCKFREAECHACGKKGHIAPACRSRAKSSNGTNQSRPEHFQRNKTHKVCSDEPTEADNTSEDEYFLHKLGQHSSSTIKVSLSLSGTPIEMEVDTGADLSIISEATRRKEFPSLKLHLSDVILKTYTGELVKIIGNLHVKVPYKGQLAKLVLVVVEGNGSSLLGRNWLKYLKLDRITIARTHAIRMTSLHNVLDQHQPLFQEGLGTVEPFRASLRAKAEATPKFCKPCPVPFAIKGAIGQELDKLEENGIVERVDHSEWAAPIAPVPKKDGNFHI